MHILIDVQGLQSASRYRGIGRSTLAMSRAIIRNAGKNRVSILLNGLFSLKNIQKIRETFTDILPSSEIFTFSAQGPLAACDTANNQRNRAAHISRNVAIAHINPDIVFIISFFEGHIDEYIVSIPDYPVSWRTICVCHDLIPLLNPDTYLSDSNFRQFYNNKLCEYARADAIFAISSSAKQEVNKYINIDPKLVINISSAAETTFRILSIDRIKKEKFYQRYKLPENFIMALAMMEPRKNIEALIEAYSQMPKKLRNQYPLVLVCKICPISLTKINQLISRFNLKPNQILFTGYLPDNDLIIMYNLCKLFIFPSLHEGFGLPPLEAMSCGAPTISSNTTSLPEVIGWSEAMFNPYNINEIHDTIIRALTNKVYYQQLKKHALNQAKKFSWDRTAKLALTGFERILNNQKSVPIFTGNAEQFTLEAIRNLAFNNDLNETDKLGVAWSLANNSFSKHNPHLLIDVSTLMKGHTRLLSLTNHIISMILAMNMPGYSLRTIYYLHNNGYFYTTFDKHGRISDIHSLNKPVFFNYLDILLVPELSFFISTKQLVELENFVRIGTQVIFILSDKDITTAIQSIKKIHTSLDNSDIYAAICYADRILCTSSSVALKLQHYIELLKPEISVNPALIIDTIEDIANSSLMKDHIYSLIAKLALIASNLN